jgi:hypothetical protein
MPLPQDYIGDVGTMPNRYLTGKATPIMPMSSTEQPTPIYGQTRDGQQTPFTATGAPAQSGSLFDYDSMSDNDLFSMAQSMGIDPQQFMGGGTNQNLDMFQIDPAVGDAVSRIFQSQRDLGNEQLRRSAIEATGSRGLNMTDTPIFDPYMRNQALFESQLRGGEASSLLSLAQDYNKQRDTFLSGLFNTQQTLQQQASSNRMALLEQGSQVGLGLNNARMRRDTGSTVSQSGLTPGQIGTGTSAIGAGLSGLSSLTGLGGAILKGLGLSDSGSPNTGGVDWSGWGDWDTGVDSGGVDWSGWGDWDTGVDWGGDVFDWGDI